MTEHADATQDISFAQLGLSEPILKAIDDEGYEAPTPIQARTIPPLLQGRDVIGQAQTGTGKTAAFAIPLLESLDVTKREVQGLVLAPTRELAIQVAEAVHSYARHLGQVRVLPVYGGQSIDKQLSRLRSGVHIVVGTPGRIMDHLRRGTLRFESLQMVVLDEADEMLRMGFIDDVEWILSQIPGARQIALFSATMPNEIRRIADRYLDKPVLVEIERKTLTVPTTEQRHLVVPEQQKLEALTRILEAEQSEGTIIFTRTKNGAAGLAEKLDARGLPAEAMHGDMSQAQREHVIRRLRSGQVEIVVATDVAARGLDVERIGLVVNYDIPYDTESYVHRIGRTGRAGRLGKAILFVTPRQRRMMREIEKYIGQPIQSMKLPTAADVTARRVAAFKEEIHRVLLEEDLEPYLSLVQEMQQESDCTVEEIAAAAARLARGDKPLEMAGEPEPTDGATGEQGMVRFFIDVGRRNNVRPGDIVGAIANEAKVPGREIGSIDIHERFSFVDLPAQYREQVLNRMEATTIRNRPARIKEVGPAEGGAKEGRPGKPRGKRSFPGKGGKKFHKR